MSQPETKSTLTPNSSHVKCPGCSACPILATDKPTFSRVMLRQLLESRHPAALAFLDAIADDAGAVYRIVRPEVRG